MAYVTPAEVKEYTEISTVKNRSEQGLTFDIIQAEADVFSYVGHDFRIEPYLDPSTGIVTLPEVVKLTIIKLAEYYAVNNSDENMLRGYLSERISDYQYTLKSSTEVASTINLESLLGPYRLVPNSGLGKGVRFRMGAF